MGTTYKKLDSVTVGSGGVASIILTAIPQTYSDLIIKLSSRRSTAGIGGVLIYTFNDDNTSIFNGIRLYGSGSAVASSSQNLVGFGSFGELTGSGATANTFASADTYIPNYANETLPKAINTTATGENNLQEAYAQLFTTYYPVSSAITKITITPGAGSISEFTTVTLYGIFNKDVIASPSTPTIGTATARGGYVDVAFTGVSNAASYTATSTPGNITGTGFASPVRVYVGTSGLTSGTSYTFTVKANNPIGSSSNSAASNSVTAQNTTIVGMGNGTSGATGGTYSTDGGSTWTGFTIPATTGANIDATGEYLVYGLNKFILIPFNQNNFYYSTTGYSSWTSVAAPVAAYKGGAVGYVPGVGFVAMSHGSGGNSAYSTTGTSWTAGSGGPNVGISLGYVAGTWFSNAHNDPNGYYSTNLGSTWTNNGTFSGPPYFGTFGFAASNGTTAVFTGQYGSSNTLWTTTTGTSITASTMPSTSSWYGSQCYGYEAAIFVSGGSTTAAASSTNGTTWTARTRISGGTANLTVYGADTGFVAVSAQSGAGGAVQRSYDGITWTSLTAIGTGVYCWTLCSSQVRNYSQTSV